MVTEVWAGVERVKPVGLFLTGFFHEPVAVEAKLKPLQPPFNLDWLQDKSLI